MGNPWPLKLRKLKAIEALCLTINLEISNEMRFDIIEMIRNIKEQEQIKQREKQNE